MFRRSENNQLFKVARSTEKKVSAYRPSETFEAVKKPVHFNFEVVDELNELLDRNNDEL